MFQDNNNDDNSIFKSISKIRLNDITYVIKDTRAREMLSNISSPLIFMGFIKTFSEFSALKDYQKGQSYIINENFFINNIKVEIGDIIICVNNYNLEFKLKDWEILKNNTDVFIGTNNINNGNKGLVPAPEKKDFSHFLKGNGSWSAIKAKDIYFEDSQSLQEKYEKNLLSTLPKKGIDYFTEQDKEELISEILIKLQKNKI